MSALLCVSLFAGALPASNAVAVTPDEAPVAVADTTEADEGAYLFVHFIGEGKDQEQVYFSVSKNGTNWTTLNNKQPVLKSEVGEKGIRDPHIVRSPDGNKFYMIATDLCMYNINQDWGKAQGAGSKNIIVWESDDLVNWTCKGAKEIAPKNAVFTWAPESIWDDERNAYMVFWAARTPETDADWTYRIWRCYTEDFDTFSEPEVYIDAEYNERRIDTTIYKEGDTYYRFTKNELTKHVYMEKSKSLSGDFELVSTYTLNGKYYTEDPTAYEGATVYKLNGENKWVLLLDSWEYKPFVTDDLSTGRFVSAGDFTFGGVTFRHGTVLPITRAEYDRLVEKWAGGNDPIEEDVTTGELVYSLDFEDNLEAGEGTLKTAATPKGSPSYESGVNGGKGISLTAGNYVQIPGAALAGSKCLTISFATQVYDENRAWMFFAAENDNEQIWQGNKEKYLGIGWKVDGYAGIKVQRYNNNGSRPANAEKEVACAGKWVHVTAVFHVDSTELYIDGELVATTGSGYRLTDILGANPIVYLGRANWGSGEFGNSTLDCFKVYNYVRSADDVKATYKADMGIA